MRLQSATMVSLADRCPRAAAFKYFSDHPKEPRPEAEDGRSIGQLLHEAMETYHQTGQSPPPGDEVGDLFRAFLPLIPLPHKGLSEGRREFKLGGVEYLVLLDWQGWSDDLPDMPPGAPAILDFKTSKDPKKYAIGVNLEKPPHDDIQAILYSTYQFALHKDAQTVHARWLYGKTKVKRKVPMPVDFSFERAQCQDLFNERIYPTSLLLQKIEKEKPDPNLVDANPKACDDYRGCWYAEENGGPCRLSQTQKRERYTDPMGILDKFPAKNTDPKAEPAETPQATPQEPPKSEVAAEVKPGAINPPDEIQDVPEDLKPEKPKTRKRTTKKTTEGNPVAGVQAVAKLLGSALTEAEAEGVLALLGKVLR